MAAKWWRAGMTSRSNLARSVLSSPPRCSPAALPLETGEVEIQRGIEYGRHDGVPLLADLYAPAAPGTYPAIVAVHGGGWQAGSRESYVHWGNTLAAHGIALMAVDYRLCKPGETSYPEAVHDVRAAVQFLRSRARDYHIDPARLALIGDSAGAHLASLVALAGDAPVFAGAYPDDPYAGVSTKVKAVIGAYGVYDLLQQWSRDQLARPRDQIVEKLLGVAPMENRRLYFDASPMSYATSDNNATAFLLTYGTDDDIVDYRPQSEAFLLALKQARFFARTVAMPGAGHFWLTDPIEEAGSLTAFLAPRLLRFLADKL
jgi:acetyl esterase/lipase